MPRPSFRPPEEEPAVPIEPDVAKARATYVKAQVEKVKAMKEAGKSAEEIKAEVSRFAEDYPALFKMLMSSETFNEASLKTMLALLERMGTGEMSQHQASVVVGQRLHNVYIKPKMPDMERTD
jgi:bacterioferritin (cytochrome b1)